MKLKNGMILREDFEFLQGDLSFSNRIAEAGEAGEIDCTGLYVLPGLVDVHTHGALGFEANQPDADFKAWQRFLLENGVTTFLPTTVTDTKENILAALDKFCDAVGINMEGPYLSVAKKGAHAAEKICEIDLDFLKSVKERVKIVTVAPEEGENLKKIKEIANMGMRVSLGHSIADYDTAKLAISEGATQITHTFNCCPPLDHRAPGLIGAAFESEGVFCEVISDGIHLHPAIVHMLYKQVGTERMVLISDAISATGLSDGKYTLAGLEVFVKDGVARLAAGNLAGSTITLLEGVRRAVRLSGIPLNEAVKMASHTPAKALGLTTVGSLADGKDADVLVLDKDLA
ncbi:MAG: N-acetylglucosamine-6-phosphate deacetylase, partial [Clostridia bacterium]|nr:N-acetylglucosamine-6-phosphate deacetylase [Clostridia bacterium]